MRQGTAPRRRAYAPVLLAAIAVAAAAPARADLYGPDRSLSLLETEYFSIVYPSDSAATAARLAGFADDEYRRVAALLGTEPRFRLPVVVTPDHEETNGYYAVYPYPRIVIYEAAIDPARSLGGFEDDLRSLFVHELTHAVSLSIRSQAEDAVVGAFGSPFGLSNYLTPASFVEGVTVSFESLGGRGRANDPLAAAMLRQDIVEGRWKSFVQASGAYDAYPSGSLYYIYGGYFSKFLQDRYGMERYAELWKGFGAAALLRPLDDTIFGRGRFSRAYGLSLAEAWKDFKDAMAPKVPIYMAVEPIMSPSSLTAISSFGSGLAIADYAAGAVSALDPASGESRILFRSGSYVSRLDADEGGTRLLVSSVRYDRGFARLSVAEWVSGSGDPEELDVRGLRDAAYLSEPRRGASPELVAVEVDGYRTDLVAIRGGEKTTLLHGSDGIGFSSPVASPDGATVFALARIGGEASVIRLSIARVSGGYSVGSIDRLALPPPLAWIRYLSLDGSALRFAWDDGSFYRLAELDGDALRIQTVPASGGVHWPVAARPADGLSRVYYLGRFSAGVSPCAFPADRGPLGFEEAVADWRPWDGRAEAALGGGPPSASAASMPEPKPYRGGRWLVPRYWYPTAAIDLDGLSSIGVEAHSADLIERFDASLAAAWDFRALGLDLSVAATLYTGPAALTIGAYDEFLGAPDGMAWRDSAVQANLGWSASSRAGTEIAVAAGAALRAFRSLSPADGRYAPWSEAVAALEGSATASRFAWRHGDPEAARGYLAAATLRLDAPAWPEPAFPTAGLEASLEGRLRAAAIGLALSGAVSLSDGLSYGPDGRAYASGSTLAASYPVRPEFAGSAAGPWHLAGEAGFRLFGAEIQRGVGPLYANRLSIRLGARGFATGSGQSPWVVDDAGWSLWAAAILTWTPAVGAYARLHPLARLEAWYRPDRDDDAYGIGFSMSAALD